MYRYLLKRKLFSLKLFLIFSFKIDTSSITPDLDLDPNTMYLDPHSVVEPEPDFLAGTGAGEKAPVPGCCCLA